MWYYAVMQVDREMEIALDEFKFLPLFSKGKIYYQEYSVRKPSGHTVLTPVFVIDFDTIVADAASRNHTFLEILRAGMKKYTSPERIAD
jgi:hypothetical protein